MPLDQIDIDKYNPNKQPIENELSFFDHLEQLRWHIIRSLIVIASIGIGIFSVKDWFFNTIVKGPINQDFPTFRIFCDLSHYLEMGEKLCLTPHIDKLIALNVADTFVITIKICFFAGFVLGFPYVFWELWRFISPALYEKERKKTRGIVFFCSLLFSLGCFFGYFVLAPFGFNFLSGFTLGDVQGTSPTLESYLGYFVMFLLPVGMIFELPVVVYLLTKLGLITAETMKTYRKIAIVSILFIAAIVTPPDVMTQFLVATPLYLLYEISIFVSKYAAPKNNI